MILAFIYYALNVIIQYLSSIFLDGLINLLFTPFGPFFLQLCRFAIPLGIGVITVWLVKFPVDKYFTFKYF